MSEWHARWDEGRIGFHLDQVHPDLIANEATFLADGPHRVLIPLCGKTLDLEWLAARGHHVVGVELVPKAVEAFFAEHNLVPDRTTQAGLMVYRHHNIEVIAADVFDVRREHVGNIDRIWDRAALIALPEAIRTRYVQHLRGLANHDFVLLQNTLDYDPTVSEGPPFAIDDAAIAAYYGDLNVHKLAEENLLSTEPRWRAMGHAWFVSRTYLIRP